MANEVVGAVRLLSRALEHLKDDPERARTCIHDARWLLLKLEPDADAPAPATTCWRCTQRETCKGNGFCSIERRNLPAGANAPVAPRYWCNKCGYRGPVQVGHQRPNGTGECGYIARLTSGVIASDDPQR